MISVMLDNDIAGHRDLFDGTLHSTGWDEYRLVKFIQLDLHKEAFKEAEELRQRLVNSRWHWKIK